MNTGLIERWDTVRFESVLDPSQVDSGSTASGTAITLFNDPVTGLVIEGVKLYSEIVNSGSYALSATLSIPYLGVTDSWSDTVFAPITSRFEIQNLGLYVLPGGTYSFTWDDLLWYVNGVLQWSAGAPGFILSANLSPMDVPLIGANGYYVGGATLNAGVPSDPPIPTGSNSETKVEGTFTCGYQTEQSAVWTAMPVTIQTSALPVPDGCTCGTGTEPTISGTQTDSIELFTLAREYQTSALLETLDCPCPPGCTQVGTPQYDHYVNTAGFEYSEAWVFAACDLLKQVVRLKDKTGDYRGFWGRYKMPEVKRLRTATCTIGDNPVGAGTTYTYSQETVTHPRQAEIIGVVGETAHAMEDTFSYQSLALYGRYHVNHTARSDVYTFVVGSGRCIVGVDCGGLVPCFEDAYSYCLLDTAEGIAGPESGQCLPILDCASATERYRAIGTYVNTWVNPHWSYRYHIEDWELLGSPAFWVLYWGLIGSQWLFNPALPLFEQRKTRNSIVESPLEASPLKTYQGTYYLGRWLGVSRFYTDEAQAPLSVAMTSASSAAWSASGGTLAHGANIAVTPSLTTVTLDYDIGQFGSVPYQYPHIANRVNVNWAGASITGVSVRLVSADGSSYVEIGTATGDLDLDRGTDTKYAGSWAIDNGAGYITDLGSDDGPHVADGESSTVMSDAERVGSFNYLAGSESAILRFVFTLSSLAGFTVEYPTFKRTAANPYQSRESRQATDLIWADGPGVRFGNHRYTGAASPPSVQGEGQPPTAIDWLCWKRQWWHGTSETGGSPSLATELATIFDSTEGTAVGDADSDTNAFILPRTLLPLATKATVLAGIVNSLREIPPLALAPRKERDSQYAETGDYCLECFSFCQEPARFVTQGSMPLVFNDPAGTPWTSVETGWPAGWAVSSHIHQVDNSEDYGYVDKNGDNYGRIRWRGCFAVINTSKPAGTGPWNWEDERGRYHRVDTDAGDIVYHGVEWSRPYPGFDRTVAVGTGDRPKVFKDRQLQRLYIVFDDSSDSYITQSDDSGNTWSTPSVAITDSHSATGNSSPFDGTNVVAALRFVSGSAAPCNIIGKTQGPGDSGFGSEFTFKDASAVAIEFEDESFHIFPAYDGTGRWILTAKGFGNTNVDEWESFDGCATWTLI